MQKHYINTVRTARYFTLGNFNSQTRKVYFLLHGYAQNADEFLGIFQGLSDEHTFIVAPEGLSHFYFKDLFTNPVSSWMTGLERENEIADYTRYLQNLYSEIFAEADLSDTAFHYIGFSQGCATLSRWLNLGKVKMNKVFLYAGEIASEIDFSENDCFVKKCSLHFVFGKDDRFVRKERLDEISNLLQKENVIFNVKSVEGRHAVTQDGIEYIKSNT
jgi:predicted esterase